MHDLLLAIGCRKSGGSIASFSRMRQTLVLPYSKGCEPRTEGSDYYNKINKVQNKNQSGWLQMLIEGSTAWATQPVTAESNYCLY